MATLSAIFRFAAIPTRPRHFGLRLLCYICISIVAWLLPPWGALVALAVICGLGFRIQWVRWISKLGGLWFFVLAPLLIVPLAYAGNSPPSIHDWWGAGGRSLTFLVLLAGSHWLTSTTTVFEIRGALDRAFLIFGARISATLSLVGALALYFVPWVLEQATAVREAGELRGVPKRRLFLAILALTLPLFVRIIEKARHTTDALELRGK